MICLQRHNSWSWTESCSMCKRCWRWTDANRFRIHYRKLFYVQYQSGPNDYITKSKYFCWWYEELEQCRIRLIFICFICFSLVPVRILVTRSHALVASLVYAVGTRMTESCLQISIMLVSVWHPLFCVKYKRESVGNDNTSYYFRKRTSYDLRVQFTLLM